MARGAARRGKYLGPRSRPLEEYYDIDFKVFGTPEWIASSFPPGMLTDKQVVPVRSSSDLLDIKSYLSSQPRLGVDTETTGADKRSGLDPRHAESRIILLQIGTPELACLVQPELIPEFRQVLESEDVIHILQNAVYDFKYILYKYSIHMNRMVDTMLNEQLLTSGLMGVSVSLEEIARKYPPHRIISKEIRKQFMSFSGVFDWKMTYYGARDINLLFPAESEQRKLLTKWKMEQAAQDEYDVIPCTAMMELGGVHFDVRVLQLSLTYWYARREQLENEILDLYDRQIKEAGKDVLFLLPEMKNVFDLQSNSQKLEALRSLGFEIDDVRRDTLEEMNTPIADLLGEYSEVMKIVSTYGENLISRIDPVTGLFYPEFHQLGSGDIESKKAKKETIATGRYSSDFQQLPRPVPRYSRLASDEEALIRSTFAAELAAIESRRRQT